MLSAVHAADYLALCGAIVANPDDDTPRLILADYIDGLDTVRVPCPTCSGYANDPCPRCNGKGKVYEFAGPSSSWVKCHECKGTGTFPLGYHTERDPASGRDEGGWVNCQNCNGGGNRTPGFVVDTSNAVRAELIRVQCELANRPRPDTFCVKCGRHATDVPNQKYCGHGGDKDDNRSYHLHPRSLILRARERELLGVVGEKWRKGPVCDKCYVRFDRERSELIRVGCVNCDYTCDAGGLLRRFNLVDEYGAVRGDDLVRVDYVRGMKWVHVTLAECVKEVPDHDNNCRCTVPSDWLRSVLTHHPDVVEVWVTDRQPRMEGAKGFYWSEMDIPKCLFNEELHKLYSTIDVARTALARAVVQWARPFIKEPS